MPAKPLTNLCPYCDNSMQVTQMACSHCEVAVDGDFPSSRLAHLPTEHQRFIEMFVLASGSLKEIATKTGVSYPTVRSRLDKVIAALRLEISKTAPTSGTILDAVSREPEEKPSRVSRSKSRQQQDDEQAESASRLIKSI